MADVNYFSGGIGAVSSLVGGFFGQKADEAQAKGLEAAAGAYRTGAEIAGQDVELEKMSTDIQEIAASRKITKTIGAQEAGVAGAGLAIRSGSALDLLRESVAQGHTTSQMLGLQGEINANQFRQQEATLLGEAAQADAAAAAAKAAGEGSMFGGILGAVGKIAGMFF